MDWGTVSLPSFMAVSGWLCHVYVEVSSQTAQVTVEHQYTSENSSSLTSALTQDTNNEWQLSGENKYRISMKVLKLLYC
jgi:hypothetical protein